MIFIGDVIGKIIVVSAQDSKTGEPVHAGIVACDEIVAGCRHIQEDTEL